MARKSLFFLFTAGLLTGLVSAVYALEKVRFGTSLRVSPVFYLLPLTAEDRGFWKENGLDVEWVAFAGATPHTHAIAAGAVSIGMVLNPDTPVAAERGLPVIMVAEVIPSLPMTMWVRTDSPYRHVRDLKGKRISVTALGAPTHVYARLISAAHGVEKDVRFVGAGGVPEQIAGMRVGAFEAMMATLPSVVPVVVGGVLKEIASAEDYQPKPWVDFVIYARKEFARTKPDVVKSVIRAMVQAADFTRKNPRWTMDKMKSFQGLSEEAAKMVYDNLKFTTTGRLDRKAVENLRKLFIEYGVMTEKAPAVDELFTNEYLS